MTYANGQVRIQSAIPEKAEYAVGDVVTLRFRMESTAQAPARTIDASSTTLANVDSCDWAGTFPAGIGGKFECARIQGGTQYPAVTYTVTEADAQAGQAVFDLTWTETPAGGAPVVTTIYGALPVAQATPEPGESTWSWL